MDLAPTSAELQRLQELLSQRDDEINILLKMLKQEKRRAAEAEAMLKTNATSTTSTTELAGRIRPQSPLLGRTSPLQLVAEKDRPSVERVSQGESPRNNAKAAPGGIESRLSRAALKAGIIHVCMSLDFLHP